jgi:phosphate starvation-inducible protein PhoH and related proteins
VNPTPTLTRVQEVSKTGSKTLNDSVLTFDDNRLASSVFGRHDQNLNFIEKRLKIEATPRGNLVALRGSAEACEQARAVLEILYARAKKGEHIGVGDVDGAIRMVSGQGTLFREGTAAPSPAFGQVSTRQKTVVARTKAQDVYIRNLSRYELVFGLGPAGTGKTYLAAASAVAALEKGDVDRIILSRPAVEAGERLGFLPGDLREKVDPYLRPLYDALHDLMPGDRVERGLQTGIIEIAPLAFMRGRTLANSAVILDEAQNCTSVQMKMFLTRLGENSRMIVAGDPTQVDLPNGQISGLAEAVRLLENVEGVSINRFSEQDVVRHELVGRIVQAYEKSSPAR